VTQNKNPTEPTDVEPTDVEPTDVEPTDVGDSASPKKERVLHTRVPAVLEQELKRFAKNLRVPVSNVVRVILEDALKVADRATGEVEDRLRKAATVVSTEREQIRETLKDLDPLADVLGYQPLILAQPTACAGCQAPLRRGDKGFLGLTADPGRRVIVCSKCVPAPAGDEQNSDEKKEIPS
jgi:hypothetical protein